MTFADFNRARRAALAVSGRPGIVALAVAYADLNRGRVAVGTLPVDSSRIFAEHQLDPLPDLSVTTCAGWPGSTTPGLVIRHTPRGSQ